jgi:hypothetical protein
VKINNWELERSLSVRLSLLPLIQVAVIASTKNLDGSAAVLYVPSELRAWCLGRCHRLRALDGAYWGKYRGKYQGTNRVNVGSEIELTVSSHKNNYHVSRLHGYTLTKSLMHNTKRNTRQIE